MNNKEISPQLAPTETEICNALRNVTETVVAEYNTIYLYLATETGIVPVAVKIKF
jgi:hypothetical protein